MSDKMRKSMSWGVLVLLILIGVWQINAGEYDFGIGLIGAGITVSVVRGMKQRRITELQKQGINPYDERFYAIGYRAAYSTLVTIILLSAGFVLIGSVIGPEVTVNPYDFMGLWLGFTVLVYIFTYYWFNRKM